MGSIVNLHKFRSIIDVPGDENYGYHSILLGLIDIGKNDIKHLLV